MKYWIKYKNQTNQCNNGCNNLTNIYVIEKRRNEIKESNIFANAMSSGTIYNLELDSRESQFVWKLLCESFTKILLMEHLTLWVLTLRRLPETFSQLQKPMLIQLHRGDAKQTQTNWCCYILYNYTEEVKNKSKQISYWCWYCYIRYNHTEERACKPTHWDPLC